jgi:DNA recombination protein RmuC
MSPAVLFLIGVIVGGALAAVVALVRQQRLTSDAARLGAELDASRRAADDQRLALTQSQTQLRDAFASLSRDALKDNTTAFLQTADQTLRAKQDAIDALLKPVRETLDRVQAQMASIDKAREGSFREVAQQLTSVSHTQEQLRQTTEGLSRSLRSPNVRGRWGEIQLRRIVELAGMLGQCDFVEKVNVTTDTGARQTPDLVIKLPGNTSLVVDAKVPIDGYLEAMNAKDDVQRQAALASHVRQVRDHIRSLGSKEYWKQFQPAPEFVVMFLPLEPLLAAAFEQDGTLLDQAASLRVIPATPMTLLALLKAVAYGWKQQQLTVNAEEIQQIGRELYDRLATMVNHLEAVGANIKQAADSYDRFVGSLEQKVLPGARRFKDLGVSSTKDINEPDRLNLSMRRVTKAELTGQPADEVIEAGPPMPLLEPDEP